MNRKDRRAAGKPGKGSTGSGNALFAQAQRHHQAGQLFEAENLYRQVLTGDRRHAASWHCIGIIALQRSQPLAALDAIGKALALNDRVPECHYNIAFAYQSLGRMSEAVSHYRQATGLKPDYAEAHTNLGNALMQLGRNDEAAASYERVIALKPTAEAHYNLANVLAQIGRFDEAVTHYRHVLAFKPDFVGAHNNLANALIAQGRSDEALTHLQRAIQLDPKLAEPYVNLGNLLLAQGKPDEAAAQFERALRVNANFADAHANLGNVYLAQGRLDDAAQSLRRALSLRPGLPEASNNLGIVLAAQGEFAEAVRCFELALARKPESIDAYNNLARAFMATGQLDNALGAIRRALGIREMAETRGLFVECAKLLPAPPDIEDFRALLLRALEERWGRGNDLARVAAKVVKQTGDLSARIAHAAEAWPRRLPADELFGPAGIAAISENRLLGSLLESAAVADLDLERFLTGARYVLVQIAVEGDGPAAGANILGFFCALARQCFLNEYVFAAAGEEMDAACDLRDKLLAALKSGSAIPELWLAVVASYFPLRSLPAGEALLDGNWPSAVADLLVQQMHEPREEQRLRDEVPVLTPIDNEVSRLVQQQYEENPYPRWTKADPPKKSLLFDQYLRGKFPASDFQPLGKTGLDILIAGCGSGQHAIESAQRFPAARVLAIDLSLTSLAYAVRKSRELGLHNVEYGQADILKLSSLGRDFDVIESSGVLHHLADPFAGWRVLLSLLRPGGFMAVGLYSEIARADIVKARSFIAERGYSASADDIHRCRQDIVAQDGGARFKTVHSSVDFFTTSACRDLLFHVQEHRLSIPQIAGFLAENALSFVGFELDAFVLQYYRTKFPADESMTDLASWEVFERDHPHTFSSMYQFWVQKRA
jgi:tetratricopeptide (TPR) repeat protein/SAM-dependent methyltransferase